MIVVISPYSQKLTSGKHNPKNYPYWQEVIDGIKEKHDCTIIQIGGKDEEKLKNIDVYEFGAPLKKIEAMIKSCDFFLSVDNFLPHLAHHKKKKGIVVWGYSDPKIFGYSENINILKSRDHLRKWQFQTWNEIDFNDSIFPPSDVILNEIGNLIA